MGKTQAQGSRQGWHAVLCLHVSWLVSTGVLDGLGVMLPTLTEQFTAQTWLIGWIISTIIAASSFVGLFSGPLEFMFGTRIMVMTSGFMIGASVIAVSLSTSATQLTLILSLVAGPGTGVSIILTRALVGRYYTTNYAIANAIGSSGFALGFIVVGPFVQLLLDTYGWRGAMLILGGFCLHLCPCGGLLRPVPTETETETAGGEYRPVGNKELVDDESSAGAANTKSRLNSFVDAVMVIKNGFKLYLRAEFWIVALVLVCFRFVCKLWQIYLVSHVQSRGFSANDAVIITTVAGVGNLVCKISFGFLVDWGWVKLRSALSVCAITSSVTLLVVCWMTSYWPMMANAFIFSGSSGAAISLCDIYTMELLGVEHLVSAFSLTEVVSTISIFSLGFFPGLIYDQSGSYDLAYIILGCVATLPLVSLFIEWVVTRRKTQAA